MATNNPTNTSNPVTVPQGGTSVATLTTAYGVLTAGTTATGAVQTLAALGARDTVLTSNGAAALPSFQAATASVGCKVGPVSTFWYPSGSTFGGMPTAVSARSRSTGTLYFHPIFITKTSTYTKIGILTSSTAAGTSVLGLYYDGGSGAPVGSPITNSNSGNISNTTTTFLTFTFGAAITLVPGVYWAAHSTSGNTTFVGPSSGGREIGGRGLGINGTPSVANIISPQCGWSQSFTYSSTLPAVGSLTAGLAFDVPDVMVFLQAQ